MLKIVDRIASGALFALGMVGRAVFCCLITIALAALVGLAVP